jgi:GNAT superfamily N-acetyltransferase
MRQANFTIERLPAQADRESHAWQAVHALCCLTGNDGAPIAPERWDFFAQTWIAPYQRILPHWTYVAVQDDRVKGYLTGCPDSKTFKRTKFFRFDLPLSVKIISRGPIKDSDRRRFLRQTFGLDRALARRFPDELRRLIESDYPAHLHMNVDRETRGQGVGSGLVERYFRDLQEAHVTGVHLYCAAQPRTFYLKVGFREIGYIRINNVGVYAMGCRF